MDCDGKPKRKKEGREVAEGGIMSEKIETIYRIRGWLAEEDCKRAGCSTEESDEVQKRIRKQKKARIASKKFSDKIQSWRAEEE